VLIKQLLIGNFMNTESVKMACKKSIKYTSTAVTVIICLFIAVLLFFSLVPGFGLFIVKSGSMEPAIHTGDIVFTRPLIYLNDLTPGTVITFKEGDILVTHRIVSVTGDRIITKGDANEDADPRTRLKSDIQGIYFSRIPYLGKIQELSQSRQTWFLMVIIPTAILVTFIVIEILKEAFKKNGETISKTGNNHKSDLIKIE